MRSIDVRTACTTRVRPSSGMSMSTKLASRPARGGSQLGRSGAWQAPNRDSASSCMRGAAGEVGAVGPQVHQVLLCVVQRQRPIAATSRVA